MEPAGAVLRRMTVSLVRCARVAICAAVLATVGFGAAGCSTGDDARARAADAAASAASWNDPAVQQRWSTALVVHSPPVDTSSNLPVSKVLSSLRQGLVEVSPGIGDEHVTAVVDYTTASDQEVVTLGARETLRGLAVEAPSTKCWNGAPCDEVKVAGATLTTMVAPTARGMASVPAWAYTVHGLSEPVVLPAVRVSSTSEVNPRHPGVSISELLIRNGTTLRVLLFVPYCGYGPNQRHLLETPGAIVVWASGTPNLDECVAPARREETFTLGAPIGDRPVVDEAGRLLLPRQVSLPARP